MNFDLIKPLVSMVSRHILSSVATVLIGAGAIQAGQQAQFVDIASGIVLWGASIAWGAWQERKHQKAKVTAFKTGAEAQAIASATPLDPQLY